MKPKPQTLEEARRAGKAVIHVMPNFGPEHTEDDCWCTPRVDYEAKNAVVVVHQLAN